MDRDRTTPQPASEGSWGGPSPRDLRELSDLFSEATREWHSLSDALHDLQGALAPQDFETALAHLEIPNLHVMKREWAKAEERFHKQVRSVNAKEATSEAKSATNKAALAPIEKGAPATRAKSPAQKKAIAKSKAPAATGQVAQGETTKAPEAPRKVKEIAKLTPETAKAPAAKVELTHPKSKNPAPAAPAATEASTPRKSEPGTAVQDRLQELVGLLKSHLSTPQAAPQEAAVSPEVTLSIAREVAGHVKDSVLDAIRDADLQSAKQTGDDTMPAEKSARKAKRIPIDDIASMIDQLGNAERD